MHDSHEAASVLDFWFHQYNYADWFAVNPDFDQKIIQNFRELHNQAILGELASWRTTPQGALAEIIILDQFSRNMFRDDPRSYAYDLAALILSQQFIKHKFDQDVSDDYKHFAYLPFMHSESLDNQQQSFVLFRDLGKPQTLDYAHRHYDVIKKFGRFPHRNITLKRVSTPQELAYLQDHPNGF